MPLNVRSLACVVPLLCASLFTPISEVHAMSAYTPPAAGHPAGASLAWSPTNQARIDALLAQDLRGQVAVFDADETLWRHDVGEGFLKYLIGNGLLRHVPPGMDVFARYEALCLQDKWMGYPYAAQVMAGIPEAELRQHAKAFFKTFQANIYPGQKQLIARLQQAGAAVWIVSASNQWMVEEGADYLGVPRDKVVGVRLEVADGLITPHIIPPMTYRQGKVDAIVKYIGQQPVLVSGDSLTDYEMLKYASRLQLVINPKNRGAAGANLTELAEQHGWPIQRW